MFSVDAIEAAFRQELVTAGLVRRPTEPGAVPPMVVEPKNGPPAPGELEGNEDAPIVVSLMLSGDVAPPAFYPTRTTVLDVRYRSASAAALRAVYALDAAVRRRMVDRPDYGLGWVMGAAGPSAGDPDGTAGVFVLQSSVFGGLSRLNPSSGAGGYDHVAKYALEVQS